MLVLSTFQTFQGKVILKKDQEKLNWCSFFTTSIQHRSKGHISVIHYAVMLHEKKTKSSLFSSCLKLLEQTGNLHMKKNNFVIVMNQVLISFFTVNQVDQMVVIHNICNLSFCLVFDLNFIFAAEDLSICQVHIKVYLDAPEVSGGRYFSISKCFKGSFLKHLPHTFHVWCQNYITNFSTTFSRG